MKAAAVAILFIALLLTPLFLHGASATQTASWQIQTLNSQRVITSEFEAKSILNITVYPPVTLSTGGIRSLTVYSQKDSNEIVRYSLGFYASGNQSGAAPRNVSINLGAFPRMIHGDTLLLQIRDPTETVEFTAAVSVRQDVEALLAEQRQYFLGIIAGMMNQMDIMQWEIDENARTGNNYLMLLGIVIGFVVAYVTRDRWLNKKKKDEETKSTTEFENFLEAFIVERYSPGDQKGDAKAGAK